MSEILKSPFSRRTFPEKPDFMRRGPPTPSELACLSPGKGSFVTSRPVFTCDIDDVFGDKGVNWFLALVVIMCTVTRLLFPVIMGLFPSNSEFNLSTSS